MTVLCRIFVFALLALWWPAALHCQMEAKGIERGECCIGKACANESGTLNQGTSIKVSSLLLKDASFTDVYHFDLQLAFFTTELEQVAPEWREHSPDWVAAWQFARRAAPPSRAPAVMLA